MFYTLKSFLKKNNNNIFIKSYRHFDSFDSLNNALRCLENFFFKLVKNNGVYN